MTSSPQPLRATDFVVSRVRRYWQTFSFVGLVFATLFFAASVTPSLLPRHYVVQGLMSGLAIAVGYGVGVGLVGLYHFLQLRDPPQRIQTYGKRVTSLVTAVVFLVFLRQMTFWQNSIRELMQMEPLQSAYPTRTALIALSFGVLLIAVGRTFLFFSRWVSRRLHHFFPERIATFLGFSMVAVLAMVLTNKVVARGLLSVADSFFAQADEVIDEGVEQPGEALRTGSPASLVSWESIGRRGKDFLTLGPSQDDIEQFWNSEALSPIRVYVGMRSRETAEERAELALEELKRVGGFDRSVLVIATPTGTGWLDPGGVDPLEYLHAGDTAIVSTQYSYLPSWITILVDPARSIVSAKTLFMPIYDHWKTLPKDRRPKLYLHGLSLGALGSEVSADLLEIFEEPINGSVWSGPPFPSRQHTKITQNRADGSPQRLPIFRDQTMVRFTNQENKLDIDKRWGPIRDVYIQYASDPMVFFSFPSFVRCPDWLSEPRGKDVSPHLRWYPIITFLQIAFDLPMATSVPLGYGHNYAPSSYIDAWVAVTQPTDWSDEDTRRLKALFAAEDAL